MKPQSIRRKIRIFLHCLFQFHKRSVYRWRTERDPTLHYNWVCADCAEKIVKPRAALTQEDIRWANDAIKAHPEWNTKV